MPASSRRSACPFPPGAERGGGEGAGGVSIDSISLIGRGGQCRIPGRPPGGVAGQRYQLCVLVSGREGYAVGVYMPYVVELLSRAVYVHSCVPIMPPRGTGRDAKTSRSRVRISTIAPQRYRCYKTCCSWLVGYDRTQVFLSFAFSRKLRCGGFFDLNKHFTIDYRISVPVSSLVR